MGTVLRKCVRCWALSGAHYVIANVDLPGLVGSLINRQYINESLLLLCFIDLCLDTALSSRSSLRPLWKMTASLLNCLSNTPQVTFTNYSWPLFFRLAHCRPFFFKMWGETLGQFTHDVSMWQSAKRRLKHNSTRSPTSVVPWTSV